MMTRSHLGIDKRISKNLERFMCPRCGEIFRQHDEAYDHATYKCPNRKDPR